MIALAMLYATALGALLGLAAAAAERAALAARRPARLAWAVALAATVAAPALVAARGRPAPPSSAGSPAALPDVVPNASADRAGWAALLARAMADAARGAASALVVPEGWSRADRPLAALWAAAALLALVRRGVGVRRLAVRARGWPARTVGGTPVRVAPDAGPAVMGVLRPEVVVPAWALGDPRLPLMLRHEREHCRAGDPLLLAAADLVAACVPWNAALWWQRAGLRAAVELDCDRRVLGGGRARPAEYGRLLLDVAGRVAVRPSLALAVGGRRTLERRIRTMTARPRFALLRASALSAVTLGALAAAAALPRPALARGAAQPPAKSGTKADSAPMREFRLEVRDSGRVLEGVMLDSAGRPTGPRTRLPTGRTQAGPLYVVDGRVLEPTPRQRADSVSGPLPPAGEIARMDVLKGDLATRKYGARGRDGVVEITTKAAAAKAGAKP